MQRSRSTTNLSSQKNILAGHPLVKQLRKDLMPLFEELMPQIQTSVENSGIANPLDLDSAIELRSYTSNESVFPQEYIYHLEVDSHVVNLVFAIERLEDICIYIGRFPQPRTFERQDITEDKWIQYHHSYFIITAVSIFDTALLLVNALLLLGIDPQKCKKNTVAKKPSVRHTSVESAITELDAIVDPYRTHRHWYVHRNIEPKLKSLEFLRVFSLTNRAGESVIDTETLDALYKITRKKIVAELLAGL